MGIVIPDTPENVQLCLCGTCPTFNGSPLTGGFFCSMGKAKEPVKKAGCVCSKCPITAKFSLKGGLWCVRGKSAYL